MSRRRKLILGAMTALVGILLIFGPRVYYSYHLACDVAAYCMNKSNEGIWIRWKTGFSIEVYPDRAGRLFTPCWVFRYRHARSGDLSKRIYVTVTDDRVFSYEGLDPLPVLGFRP